MCTTKRNNITRQSHRDSHPPPFNPSTHCLLLPEPILVSSQPCPQYQSDGDMTCFSITPLLHHLQCLGNFSFVIRSHLSQKTTKTWGRAPPVLPLSSERWGMGGVLVSGVSNRDSWFISHEKKKKTPNQLVTPRSWSPLTPCMFLL